RSRRLVHRRCNAVRRQHEPSALGHAFLAVDEDCAAPLEIAHDVHVVHDLLAYVDRRAVQLEGSLDRFDRSLDACTEPARRGEKHALHHAADGSPGPSEGAAVPSGTKRKPATWGVECGGPSPTAHRGNAPGAAVRIAQWCGT